MNSVPFRVRAALVLTLALALVASACSSEESVDEGDSSTSDQVTVPADESSETQDADAEDASPLAVESEGVVRLLTHDSFSVPDELFEQFTLKTGYDVEVVRGGDTGSLVSRAALTNDDPEGDVLFGIDNTFLQRGLDTIAFLPYEAPGLDDVPDELELDDTHRVTPIDFGDVCINYWVDAVPSAPATLEDLTAPELAGSFVTQDPETSSPGFAFLLATIARFGDDWENYWQELVDGGMLVTSSWKEAYQNEFTAGGGERSIMTSYASSPAAEMLFATEPLEVAPTAVLDDGCFRQIEFAGVLAATEIPEAATALIDFMLSPAFQETVPLNMFVYPANETVALPPEFEDWATVASDPLTLTPGEIEQGRAEWTARWAEIVLDR